MKLQDITNQLTVIKAQIQRFGIQTVTSVSRPTAPGLGQSIYEGDTNKLMVWNGIAWVPYGAGGQLAFAETTTAATTNAGTGAEISALNTNPVTIPSGRRIRITVRWWDHLFTVSGDLYFIRIREDGLTGTQLDAITFATLTTQRFGHGFWTIYTPTAGSHSYYLTVGRAGGTGSLTLAAASGLTMKILVEDLGPA